MKYTAIIARFVVLVCLQVLVFNRFLFQGYFNPYVYILFIIYLPTTVPRWGTLLWAFGLGLAVDIFENSAGLHAAASVFLAYLRPVFLGYLTRGTEQDRSAISFRKIAPFALGVYALSCIFMHHLLLFSLESFHLSEWKSIIKRTFFSTLFTFVFVLLFQLWNFRRNRTIP
jgi:rod shape-determining protein MreD